MDQNVVTYLTAYRGKYPQGQLIAALRRAGHTEQSILEGIVAVYSDEQGPTLQQPAVSTSTAAGVAPAPEGIPTNPIPAVSPEAVVPPIPEKPTIVPPTTPVRPASQEGIEERVGARWASVIGIIAIVLGIAMFLKYAFDSNWIGETGRVLLGVVAGLIFLVFGELLIRRYSRYAQLLTAGGLTIQYLSFFSAYQFYHLIGPGTAFAFFIGITAMGMLLALRYDGKVLMLGTIIGGFLSPLMASSGGNHQYVLFSYIFILDIAVLLVSFLKGWRELNIFGAVATLLMLMGWYGQFYTHDQLLPTFFFHTLFFLLYSLSLLARNIFRSEPAKPGYQILFVILGFLYFGSAVTLLARPEYKLVLGGFALLVGLYYFLLVALARQYAPENRQLQILLGLLAASSITLAFPLAFSGPTVIVAWLLEATVILIFGYRVASRGVVGFGVLVLVLALIRLLEYGLSPDIRATLVFNGRFGVFLLAAALLFIVAAAAKRATPGAWKTDLKTQVAAFVILANCIIFIAGRNEINLYSMQAREEIRTQFSGAANGPSMIALSDEYVKQINRLEYRRSISFSFFYILYGIVLLTAGALRRARAIRLGGLALLVIAVLKLFFYDLWSLGTPYRIVVSLVLGIVLLLVSYLYQRFHEKARSVASS